MTSTAKTELIDETEQTKDISQVKWTIYEPNHRAKIGLFASVALMFANIYNSRELIWQLFRRDFFMAYKKSFLGMTWIFISPLIGIVSWVFMNMAGVLNPGSIDIPYPVFVLLGSSIWGLFMGFYNSGLVTLESGAGLIQQVKYEHEALLFKEAAQRIANFLISFLVNIIVILSFGLTIHWQIVFFPLFLIPLLLLGGGLGLLVGLVGVVMPDLKRAFSMVMGTLMFITPVVYTLEDRSGWVATLMRYNPLSYLISAPRDMIFYGSFAYWQPYWYSAAASFVVFAMCWRVFFLAEERVVEKLI